MDALGSRRGGVLCICPSADAPAISDGLAKAGFDLRRWDNGTPDAASRG